MVFQGDDLHMSFGCMGANMQPQGQVQILLNVIDRGMNPQEAIDASRVRVLGGNRISVNLHFHLTSSPALLHLDIRLFRAKTLQPIACSPTTFCTVSWEVLKRSQSIQRLVHSAVAPIRGWMAWPLVIEYC